MSNVENNSDLIFSPNSFLDLDSVFIRRNMLAELSKNQYVLTLKTDNINIVYKSDDNLYITKIYEDEVENHLITYEKLLDIINESSKEEIVACRMSNNIFDLVKFQLASSHAIKTDFTVKLANIIMEKSVSFYENMSDINCYINLLENNK